MAAELRRQAEELLLPENSLLEEVGCLVEGGGTELCKETEKRSLKRQDLKVEQLKWMFTGASTGAAPRSSRSCQDGLKQ